jgi:Fe-S-cluster containining protein
MKYIDIDKLDELPGKRIEDGDTFQFQCHPELDCFNQCCRNLNLFLYPYDVVRLKQKLMISSDEFLDKYVDVVLRENSFFPDVLLNMSDDREKTCPFLTELGCGVYPDRPDACRMFPLEQGEFYDSKTKKANSVYFFRPPDFCLGQHEKRKWSAKAWKEDQEAALYNRMTGLWADVKRLFQTDPWGSEGPNGPKGKMAFMATYNIDRFSEFLFNSSFLKRYKVKSTLLKKIKNDDTVLLKFGFEWVKLFVWGIRSKNIKPK